MRVSLPHLVSSMPSLPSPPEVYLELLKKLRTAEPNVRAIAALVSRDVALTAKLLQLTRSAYFGINWTVRSAQQAIDLIGLDILRALVLNHSIASQFGGNTDVLNVVWRESLACATMAQAIAKDAGHSQEHIESAFIAGLLHDAGILILSSQFGDKHREARAIAEKDGISLSDAERKVLGASHAEIGAYLLGLWGLPDAIVEPVAFHHEPAQCTTRAMTHGWQKQTSVEFFELEFESAFHLPFAVDIVGHITSHLGCEARANFFSFVRICDAG